MTSKSALDVTVNYATANGSATAGANQDYDAKSGQLKWTAGETGAKSVDVQLREDTLDENDETFTVTLSGAANATVATATATTTITDDDPAPLVKPITDVEVEENAVGAPIAVVLDAPSAKTITISYQLGSAGTATLGSDFTLSNGTLTYAPGETTKSIPVSILEDTIAEPNETIVINLFGHVNVRPGDVDALVTIKDDGDAAPAPTVPAKSQSEGNSGTTNFVFQVTLAARPQAVTFNWRIVAGTADGSDYIEEGGALPFPGSATATTLPVTIRVKGDAIDELDETFTLQLLNASSGAVVSSAVGTITNDDNNSKLSINDASADEPGTMTFTVTLSQASARQVGVNWATADGTATAGVDYTAGSGALTFAPGELTKTLTVAVLGDSTTEDNETLKVNLSNPTGIPAENVLDGQGDGTIVDQERPPSLSISDVLAREGTGATFTVTLAGTTLRTVTVSFNTIDATAKAGSDYSARTGTLTFAPGEKEKTITVTVLDDTVAEPTEDFFVGLGDPVNATITKNRGLGAIEASDQVATRA